MGQRLSKEKNTNDLDNIASTYPGIIDQLKMAFDCHDIDKVGTITLSQAEPLVRHLLLQYGLLEYMTKIITQNGELDMEFIKPMLYQYTDINYPVKDLNSDQFQKFSLCWIKFLLDMYQEDQKKWLQIQEEENKKRNEKIAQALNKCRFDYGAMSKKYSQATLNKQDYERQNILKKKVYNTEKTQVNETKNLNDDEVRLQIIRQLAEIAKNDKCGKSFIYSSNLLPYGAYASAGSPLPIRRKYKDNRIR